MSARSGGAVVESGWKVGRLSDFGGALYPVVVSGPGVPVNVWVRSAPDCGPRGVFSSHESAYDFVFPVQCSDSIVRCLYVESEHDIMWRYDAHEVHVTMRPDPFPTGTRLADELYLLNHESPEHLLWQEV
jgi:hypothetical protein